MERRQQDGDAVPVLPLTAEQVAQGIELAWYSTPVPHIERRPNERRENGVYALDLTRAVD